MDNKFSQDKACDDPSNDLAMVVEEARRCVPLAEAIELRLITHVAYGSQEIDAPLPYSSVLTKNTALIK